MSEAYGGFFLLRGRVPNLLLLAATLVDLQTGLGGLLGLLGVELVRRLGLPPRTDDLDRINGLLLGLLMGATFAPGLLLALAGPVAALITCGLAQSRWVKEGFPLLALPFAVGGWLLWSAGTALLVPRAVPHPMALFLPLPHLLEVWLAALGGVYLSPYALSGVLVLVALLTRSRYLACLSLLGFGCSEITLLFSGAIRGGSTSIVAGTGAIVAAILVGLLTSPSGRSLATACGAASAACLLYLATVGPLAGLGLVPLALPFLVAVWWAPRVTSHSPEAGWLAQPELPEESSEKAHLARARGQAGGVALEAPFEGRWRTYQSFDGAHTHQADWRHALDFVQTFGGRSFRGTGNDLADYHAFGRTVLSPASGVVVDCRDDLEDNIPGEVDTRNRFGNYLLVDIGGGLYALVAHLQQGSLKVALGQTVMAGQEVACCGNSGRSPQPHIHLHLQRGLGLGSATVPFHLTGVVYEQQYSLRCRPSTGSVVERPKIDARLAAALRLQVGQRMLFCCESETQRENTMSTLSVELDLAGVFWLTSEGGARLAFHQSGSALSFFWRCRKSDPLLDAVAIALGVTPLMDGPTRWADATPQRLLGARPDIFTPLGLSCYRRQLSSSQEWLQFGEHRLSAKGPVVLQSRVVLHAKRGLSEIILWEEGRTLLRARLVGKGLCDDMGIPGWMQGYGQAPPSPRPSGDLEGEPTNKM